MGVKRTEGLTKREKSYHRLHLQHLNNTLPVFYLPWDKTQISLTLKSHLWNPRILPPVAFMLFESSKTYTRRLFQAFSLNSNIKMLPALIFGHPLLFIRDHHCFPKVDWESDRLANCPCGQWMLSITTISPSQNSMTTYTSPRTNSTPVSSTLLHRWIPQEHLIMTIQTSSTTSDPLMP